MNNKKNGRTIVIIPCFNEEATIGSIVLKVKNHANKVLVIDDGCLDDTVKIAKTAGAHVLSHGKNYGKSKAIKTGFKYALQNNYDYIVTIDGDGQHNADEIPKFIKNLKSNNNDVVIGYRTRDNTEMPGWRKIGKRLLDYTTSFGNGGRVTDSQNGFRAFNKKAVKSLINNINGSDFTIESEQLIKAHKLGLKVAETDITCRYKNLKNTSKKDPATHGFSVLRYILWLVAEKRPLLFIGVPGFILTTIGLIFGMMTLQKYNSTGFFQISYAILVSIFLIMGVILMFMGITLNVLPHIIRQARQEETMQ